MIVEPTQRRRWWTVAAVMLVLGCVLAWWAWGPVDSSGDDAGAAEPAELAVMDDEAAAAPDTPAIQAPPAPEQGLTAALEQFKQRTRYPATTRRIAQDARDLLNPGARYENRRKLPGDKNDPNLDWEVLFTADRYFVRGKEPLLVTLQLWHDGESVLPGQVSMLAETVAAGQQQKLVRLSTQADGSARTAVFTPNDHWPEYAGEVRVTAEFSAQGLQRQQGTLDFFFTAAKRIPAEFTGRIFDRLQDGDLLFDIEVDVRLPGTYRIDGSLFDRAGAPFGWARFEGQLPKGTVMISLRYYGLLFHDAQAAGPYILRHLHGARLRPGDTPHKEDMPELGSEYTTTAVYALGSFRTDVNNSPRRQRMIKMYEDAIRRGVKLTDPAYTGNE